MTSMLRATAILGSSSLVGVVVGVVTSKIYAILVGPEGLGSLALLQSLVGLSGLIAGLGIGAGLVKLGAGALGQGRTSEITALKRAAWLLFWLAGGIALLFIVAFRRPISGLLLGTPEHAGDVALMGLALVFTLASGVQTSILNAHHLVGALARLAALNSITGGAISVLLIWQLGAHGIPFAIIASSAVGWIISRSLLRRHLAGVADRVDRKSIIRAVRALLRFGLPYAASMLVGAGVQLVIPITVLHQLGAEQVGFYRAAATISVSYLGFLLAAMAQDYFPRVSAQAHNPEALNQLVNQQYRLVMLLGVPVIFAAIATATVVIPIVYTPQFTPAVPLLVWQLAGTVFKFASWTLAFVLLARSGSTFFFLTELVAGTVLLLTSWIGMRLYGLEGLGVAFVTTYLVYGSAVWIAVQREVRILWTVENRLASISVLLTLGIIAFLAHLQLTAWLRAAAAVFAMIAGLASVKAVLREVALSKRAAG